MHHGLPSRRDKAISPAALSTDTRAHLLRLRSRSSLRSRLWRLRLRERERERRRLLSLSRRSSLWRRSSRSLSRLLSLLLRCLSSLRELPMLAALPAENGVGSIDCSMLPSPVAGSFIGRTKAEPTISVGLNTRRTWLHFFED